MPLFWNQFVEVPDPLPHDLRLVWFSQHMPRGGGGQKMHFPPQFFGWLCHQLLVVNDYAYASVDFRWDLDLPLPPGE